MTTFIVCYLLFCVFTAVTVVSLAKIFDGYVKLGDLLILIISSFIPLINIAMLIGFVCMIIDSNKDKKVL